MFASGESVLHNYSANLLDLIRLRFVALRLEIENLVDALFREDVVAAADPLVETQTPQQVAKIAERNIRI